MPQLVESTGHRGDAHGARLSNADDRSTSLMSVGLVRVSMHLARKQVKGPWVLLEFVLGLSVRLFLCACAGICHMNPPGPNPEYEARCPELETRS